MIKEFEEAKDIWRKSSLILKIFIVVSLFLTVSSVTSLADKVFEWKGFILDAIEFYRSWITEPIKNLLLKLNLNLFPIAVDSLVAFSLAASGILRVLWDSYIFSSEKSKSRRNMNIGMTLLFLYALYDLIMKYSKLDVEPTLRTVMLVPIIFLSLPFIMKTTKREKVLVYTPIIIAVLISLILGAINVGLTRAN